MPFEIYIKQEILNKYSEDHLGGSAKIVVEAIDIVHNSIKLGNFYVPISNVLYIKEVI